MTRNFSFNKKESERYSQNPKKVGVRKTPLKPRIPRPENTMQKRRSDSPKTESASIDLSPKDTSGIESVPLNPESGARCLDLSMDIESVSRNLSPNETSEIERLQELFNTESSASGRNLSMVKETSSKNLLAKETSGIEGVQYPFNTETDAPGRDLSMENEDLNINRDIDKDLKSNEVCKIYKTYEGNCDSSSDSPSDDEQFEETHLDIENSQARQEDGKRPKIELPRKDSQKVVRFLDEKLEETRTDVESSQTRQEGGTWTKIELPREIWQNVVRFLCDVPEKSNELDPDMKMHLLVGMAKNIIETQLESPVEEAGKVPKIPEKGSRFGKRVKLIQAMIDNSMKLSDIVVDYENSFHPERLGESPGKTKLFLDMMEASLELNEIVLDYDKVGGPIFGRERTELIQNVMNACLDLRKIIVDYEESLNPRFSKNTRAKLLQEVKCANIKLTDLVVDYIEISNPRYSGWREEYWEEDDPKNVFSFPTFVGNFILVAALFAVFLFPALFAKYAPSKSWPKCFFELFNLTQCTDESHGEQ